MKLAELRKRKGHSVRSLADAADLSPTSINQVELGKKVPGLKVIRLVSAVLDVDPLEVDEFRTVLEGAGIGKAAQGEP